MAPSLSFKWLSRESKGGLSTSMLGMSSYRLREEGSRSPPRRTAPSTSKLEGWVKVGWTVSFSFFSPFFFSMIPNEFSLWLVQCHDMLVKVPLPAEAKLAPALKLYDILMLVVPEWYFMNSLSWMGYAQAGSKLGSGHARWEYSGNQLNLKVGLPIRKHDFRYSSTIGAFGFDRFTFP